MTLTTFLLARIGEDEAAASRQLHTRSDVDPRGAPERAVGPGYHLHSWDPERVLAECRVKRELLVLAYEATGLDQTVDMERETDSRSDSGVHYVGDRILRALPSVYDGHRDFDAAWRM